MRPIEHSLRTTHQIKSTRARTPRMSPEPVVSCICAEAFSTRMPFAKKKNPKRQAAAQAREVDRRANAVGANAVGAARSNRVVDARARAAPYSTSRASVRATSAVREAIEGKWRLRSVEAPALHNPGAPRLEPRHRTVSADWRSKILRGGAKQWKEICQI